MLEIRRSCCQCFRPTPSDWNQRSCPFCGGRIKLRLVRKRPRKQPKVIDTEKKEARETPIRVTRRLPSRNSAGIFTGVSRSILGPRFVYMHPLLFFIMNVLTLGCRSVFWVFYNMPSLNMMVKHEERVTKTAVYLWLTSYVLAISFLAVAGAEFAASDFDIAVLLGSLFPRCAALSMSVSLLTDKYLQYWMRAVIIDRLQSHEMEMISTKATTFAPSPLLIWFLGFPYIQLHINRMIKKKGLLSYTWSKEQHNIATSGKIVK